MRYHRQKRKNRAFKAFILLTLLLLLLLFLIDMRIRPLIKKVSSYQTQIIATDIISHTVYDALSTQNFGYENLVTLSRNDLGNITSVENNMYEINKLHTYITYSINEQYDNISKKTIIIPIGSLSGFNLFYGRGPELAFRLDPVGSVRTNLISKFTSTGVNQSLHEIILEVNCDVSAVIPGYTTVVKVSSQYIIASTVIVGDIPDSFTYISGDERDEISKIMDYKN